MTSSKFSPWSEHTIRRRVQFHEVDSAGIVHFSNYFRFMEEAEHALWRAAGLSIAPPDATVGFPRVHVAFDYRRPLRFEDEVDVTIRIVKLSRRTIQYACTLRAGNDLAAEGVMTIVCVRMGVEPLESASIPEEIASRFEAVAGDA